MSKSIKKIRAQELRRKGMSLRGISLKLCVSKSSVSLWCADIVLTQKQIEHLSKEAVHKGLKGRLVGA